MSMIPRCCVCDAPLNPYGGGPACGGVRCAKYEATEEERLTVSERDPVECVQCGATPIREVLDGDPLCQSCCDAWARGERDAA